HRADRGRKLSAEGQAQSRIDQGSEESAIGPGVGQFYFGVLSRRWVKIQSALTCSHVGTCSAALSASSITFGCTPTRSGSAGSRACDRPSGCTARPNRLALAEAGNGARPLCRYRFRLPLVILDLYLR